MRDVRNSLSTILALASCFLFGHAAHADEIEDLLAPIAAEAAAAPARLIEFSERRMFSFRKEPIELSGIARIDREHGISLEYPDEGKVMIVDDSGLTLRKLSSDGKTRDRRAQGADAELPRLLDALFRFDLPTLRERFEMTLEPGEGGPDLVFAPKEEGAVKSIRARFVEGRPAGFLIELKGNRRVEIVPRHEEALEAFDAETLRRYFKAR